MFDIKNVCHQTDHRELTHQVGVEKEERLQRESYERITLRSLDNNLHWQLEEYGEKPEAGELGHSLAKGAQVAKVQSHHLVHRGDYE